MKAFKRKNKINFKYSTVDSTTTLVSTVAEMYDSCLRTHSAIRTHKSLDRPRRAG